LQAFCALLDCALVVNNISNCFTAFNFSLVGSSGGAIAKSFFLIIAIGFFSIFLGIAGPEKFEVPFLHVFSVSTALLLFSVNDFTVLFLLLELQSFTLYLLAVARTYPSFGTLEAGIKYFILGGFVSGFLLLAIAFFYALTGTFNFTDLTILLMLDSTNLSRSALSLAIILFLTPFFFKLGLFPFHFWLPDVYAGAPLTAASFFAAVSKIPILFLLIKCYYHFAWVAPSLSYDLLMWVSLGSIVVGSLGGLYQLSLLRLIAFSGIAHMGFIFAGIATGSANGLISSHVYILIYFLLSLNLFSVLLIVLDARSGKPILHSVQDLAFLGKVAPVLALFTALNFLSMAGIPPLAGFYGKFYIILSLVADGFYFVAFSVLVASVISAFYYVRLVKIIFFEKSAGFALVAVPSRYSQTLFIILTLINLCFIFFLDSLFVHASDFATHAIFNT